MLLKKHSLFSDLDNQSFLNFKMMPSYCLYVFLLYFPLEVFKYLTIFHVISTQQNSQKSLLNWDMFEYGDRKYERARKMQNAKHKMQIVGIGINHFSCKWKGHLDTGDTCGKNYYYEALKKWSEEPFSQANTTP